MHINSNKYKAKLERSRETEILVYLHTPEEAAVCVARWVRDNGEMAPKTPMIAAEAVAAATVVGITLLPSQNGSGFGQMRNTLEGRFRASVTRGAWAPFRQRKGQPFASRAVAQRHGSG